MKREIRRSVRFSKSENEQIIKKLNQHNLSFSDFARSAILEKEIKTKLTLEYIYHIQKIGNNLNQIAKQMNTKKSDVPNSEILKLLIDIKNDIEISEE